MDFQVIVTLGPSNMNESVLRQIDSLGPCIYRINGAHTDADDIPRICETIQKTLPGAKIMVDLPGNKVRVSGLRAPILLEKGKMVAIKSDQLNFRDFYKYLKPGDTIHANDSVYTLEVESVDAYKITLLSHSTGPLTNNKGLHAQGIHQDIPFLFEKDLALIQAGTECKVDIISLSFVRTAEDVRHVKGILRELNNEHSQLFAKIETLSAVRNLGHILKEVDTVNVDRGDLSTDVGLFELASYQERIVEAVRRAGKKVFLATQFLKNMEHYPIPLIAEIIDLHKTIKTGIHGIQLSEETAVGKYPVDCVRTVFKSFYQSFSG